MYVARHCIPIPTATQPPLALLPVSSPHLSRSEAHGCKVLVQVSKACPTQHGASIPQLRSWAEAPQGAAPRGS